MSDWKARINDDWERFGVNIVWAREIDRGGREMTNGSTGWVSYPGDPIASTVEPLRLREDLLRALHAELLRYFDGADDARMLRKDYDAERARVDKLIDLATRPPIVLPPPSAELR